MNDNDAEKYVNYFIKFIALICFIQTISILYNKLVLNKDSRKKSIELWWNGDNFKNDCRSRKNNFKLKIINNFITNEECDYIISISKDHMQRSKTGSSKYSNISKVRTSTNYFFTDYEMKNNLILKDLSRRIADISGYPSTHQEPFTVLKYEKGDYYDAHYDSFNCDVIPRDKKDEILNCLEDKKRIGKRVASCILYLNTVEEGGSTAFPNHGSYVSAEKGKFAIWKNYLFDSIVDSCSLHMGTPPKKGIKWVLVSWIRDKPWTNNVDDISLSELILN